jgi:hypothetical protein
MDVEGIDNVKETVGQNGLDNGREEKSSRWFTK